MSFVEWLTICGIGVGLAMDAFAVSVVSGSVFKELDIKHALSYGGFELGKRIGHFFENKIEIAGGLILIGIGIKILITHLIEHAN